MDDLITWLRAQLDRQERYALKASPGPWKANAEHDEVIAVDDAVLADGFALNEPQLRATVDHIVENDPARMLREVESKRAILGGIQMCHACGTGRRCIPHDVSAGLLTTTRPAHPVDEQLIRLLAAPFSDRPGYREEEWKP